MEPLTVSSRRRDGWSVVEVAGELDISTAYRLGDHLEDVIGGRGPADVVLDLSRLEFCDASGLSVVAWAHHAARDRDGRLRLVCPEGLTRRLLRITELADAIPVHGTVAEALESPVEAQRDEAPSAATCLA
ncbi:STAS domain-containing protein [Streptomyces sp. ME01-24h]|nr:STAS domain-containing protein [Streptomyces sp. ME19-03-3]MDX3355372.1 STAS domain-containing protein [Streptomyces sp. ME01-24h]